MTQSPPRIKTRLMQRRNLNEAILHQFLHIWSFWRKLGLQPLEHKCLQMKNLQKSSCEAEVSKTRQDLSHQHTPSCSSGLNSPFCHSTYAFMPWAQRKTCKEVQNKKLLWSFWRCLYSCTMFCFQYRIMSGLRIVERMQIGLSEQDCHIMLYTTES